MLMMLSSLDFLFEVPTCNEKWIKQFFSGKCTNNACPKNNTYVNCSLGYGKWDMSEQRDVEIEDGADEVVDLNQVKCPECQASFQVCT